MFTQQASGHLQLNMLGIPGTCDILLGPRHDIYGAEISTTFLHILFSLLFRPPPTLYSCATIKRRHVCAALPASTRECAFRRPVRLGKLHLPIPSKSETSGSRLTRQDGTITDKDKNDFLTDHYGELRPIDRGIGFHV